MSSLGSSSPPEEGGPASALSAAPGASSTKNRHVRRLLQLTDRLVSLMPRPVRAVLGRPLTSAQQRTAESTARIVQATLVLSLVSFALLGIIHLGNELLLGGRVAAFDAEEDGGMWTWASVAVQAAGATVLALLAASSVRWRAYALCGLGLAFLSLDDAVLIHEKLGYALSFFPHSTRLIWPALYLPLMTLLGVLLWRIAEAQNDPRVRALVRGGLVALVIAVLLEVATPLLFALGLGDTMLYELEVVVEEGLEMVGWTLITGGLAVALLHHLAGGSRSRDDRP